MLAPANPDTADLMADSATYEELASLENAFDDVDNQIIARQYLLSKPLYAKRSELIRRIPNFWTIALEQAPADIDQFIQPTDSKVLAECLEDISLDRFEIPETIPDNSDDVEDYGQPRSFKLTFRFGENEWFTDSELTKTLWYRRSKDGFAGLCSEPVKINWKKGKDLTGGLLDASVKLFQAQKKAGEDVKADTLPEYAQLKKKIDASNEGTQSFFTWFGYRGPWISEEESKEATKRWRETKGNPEAQADDNEAEDADEEELDAEAEIFPEGEVLAQVLAEDFYTGAIKYFTEAQEADLVSDDDFEEDDEEDMEGDEEDAVPDLKAIINSSSKKSKVEKSEADDAADQPPKKKRKA